MRKDERQISEFNWKKKNVLVTGGASFIGSTLVDELLLRGANIRIVDDLSSGKLENIKDHISKKRLEFIKKDLREPGVTRNALKKIDYVFHLAADHGGRGYVDRHQAGPASNLFLDGLVFWESLRTNIEKVIFASSGCVYPNYLQKDVNKRIFLAENTVTPPYDPDNMYGWSKLMSELTLQAYHKEYNLKAVSCRYFAVYGPRGLENHSVIAMIARAFIKQNPIEVWGDGKQIRNWTYVDDIVSGTILAAEKINDASAVNLGTMERTRVVDAVREVLRYTKQDLKIEFKLDMPTGPMNRVANNRLAKKLLGWNPKVSFFDGLHKTIDWYFANKKRENVRKILNKMLTERHSSL